MISATFSVCKLRALLDILRILSSQRRQYVCVAKGNSVNANESLLDSLLTSYLEISYRIPPMSEIERFNQGNDYLYIL